MRKINISHSYKFIWLFILLAGFALLASGCEEGESESSGTGPATENGVAIVYPENEAHFSVGDFVDLHAEVAQTGGLNASVLMINGQAYRHDQFPEMVENGDLYQPWTPTAPGIYTLQVIMDGGAAQAASNIITVYVDEMPIEEAPEEEEEEPVEETVEEECVPPIATTIAYANCRLGPGTAYKLVDGLGLNESFSILAKSRSGNWFKVQWTESASCWIWRMNTSVCGNLDEVPVDNAEEKDESQPEEVPEEVPDKPEKDITPEGPTIPTKESGPTQM